MKLQPHLASLAFLLYLLAVPAFSFSQAKDTPVKYEELVFHSDFEKKYFDKFFIEKDSTDMIPLLLAASPNASEQTLKEVNQKLQQTFEELEAKMVNQTERETVRLIHTTLTSKFLKIPIAGSTFDQVFTDKKFNDVSSTALCALVLKHFRMKYEIRETPLFVHLVVYSLSGEKLMETTEPAEDFQFDESLYQQFADRLLEESIISPQEHKKDVARDVFNRHFFSSAPLTLRQLAGLHYWNRGVYLLKTEKNSEASQAFSKAYLLYPCPRTAYLLQTTLSILATRKNYERPEEVNLLAQMMRFRGIEQYFAHKALVGEFDRLANQQFVIKKDRKNFDASYQLLLSNVANNQLKDLLTVRYHYYLAYDQLQQGKPDVAKEDLDRMFSLAPANKDVQFLITEYAGQKLQSVTGAQDLLDRMLALGKKYPFLAQNPMYVHSERRCHLELAYTAFQAKNAAKGEEHLLAYEKVADASGDNQQEDQFIGKAYSEAANFYYEKNDKNKMREMINRGLKLSPNNEVMKLWQMKLDSMK